MNFSRWDYAVLVVMPLAIIAMSFVFPALGLTNADTAENEVPDFSIENDRFDIAGDVPRTPGTPTNGELWFDGTKDAQLSDNTVWLNGDTSNGTEVTLTGLDDGTVTVNNWTSGTASSDQYNLTGEGQQFVHSADGWVIAFTVTEYNASQQYYEVRWEVQDEPSGSGWIERIPVIGTAFAVVDATAQVLAWFGSLIWWGTTFVIETGLNVIGMMYDVTSFFFGLLSWMTGVYAEVISSADGFVTVFVLIPGILLSVTLSKLVMVAISLLPTT